MIILNLNVPLFFEMYRYRFCLEASMPFDPDNAQDNQRPEKEEKR